MEKDEKKVLITGISGWIAQYCAVELLKNGYKVKGSLRTPERKKEVIKALSKEVTINNNLEFCTLDLLKDDGWDQAMQDCTYAMHIASPFIIEEPRHEDELIKPAKEGTLRALRSAKKAQIKRIVLTSSVAAMFSHLKTGSFNESTWTDLNDKSINSYQKSKTIAEKTAWDFINSQTGSHTLEMSVINPGGVMGPCLSDDISSASLNIFTKLITKQMPGIPNLAIQMVDVRDVAKHHYQAMISPEANNKRLISAHSNPTKFISIATLLKENGYNVPTNKVPSFLLKILSLIDKEAKGMLPLLDRHIYCNNEESKKLLNWDPIPLEKTFLDMAKSVQEVLNKNSN